MNRRSLILRILVWLFIALFLVVLFVNPARFLSGEQESALAKMAFLRLAALPVFICCALLLRLCLFAKPMGKHLLLLFPALLVAANNFPWLALLGGSAEWQSSNLVFWLLLQVVAVGIMEELAFRGILLPLLLEKMGRTKKGIWCSVLLSAVIFGALHLLNLVEGQNPGAVLMQVGYSTLLGAMCAVLFLGTGNLAYCAAVHILYNFGGGVSTYLVKGEVWNLPTVLCTVLVALFVFVWYFFRVIRMAPDALPVFQKPEIQKKDGQNNA